jgi:serralysin
VLTGALGNDTLTGGLGLDRMNGGGGRDVFDFNRVVDTGHTLATADVISGFVHGGDRIDLSTLDANASVTGNQAFTFIGAAAFSGNATGQLRFESACFMAARTRTSRRSS